MPNAVAWLVFDHNYWEKFGIFGITLGGEVPDYLHRSDTLTELAAKIGVDETGLIRTVERFNPEAARGRDPHFNRGKSCSIATSAPYYPRLGKYSPDARFPAATAGLGRASQRRSVRSSASSPYGSQRRTTPNACAPSSSDPWRRSSDPC